MSELEELRGIGEALYKKRSGYEQKIKQLSDEIGDMEDEIAGLDREISILCDTADDLEQERDVEITKAEALTEYIEKIEARSSL